MAQQAPHIALELLEERYPAEQAERIFVDKVKRKPLYLRPTETTEADAREQRRRERARKAALRKQNQKPRPLSAREKRLLNIYDVPREAQKYSIYEPLHRMWIGYVQEMLGDNCMPVKPATAARFCSADFHGAEVEIVRARCVSRVGLKGIVVKDTKFTFEIVTRKDELKVVPKEHSIFRFEVPRPATDSPESQTEKPVPGEHADSKNGTPKNLIFELHGSQFMNRAPDRANKKFKPKNLSDL